MGKTEIITITIDSELMAQVEDLIKPMGISIEELINHFFHWCINNPREAAAYLQSAQEEQAGQV